MNNNVSDSSLSERRWRAAIVRITLYDDATGTVEHEIVSRLSNGGAHGYEVAEHMRRLGERLAPILDPYHES